MAKIQLKFSCGHTGFMKIYGTEEEIEKKINYFQTKGLCNKCLYEEKSRNAKEYAEKNNMKDVEMLYDDYRKLFPNNRIVPHSRDAEKNTVFVYLTKEQEELYYNNIFNVL